ncbi:hypothetical protein BST95_12695 [Halioglobus japonicus]|uniref:AAA+ ATPase domain-containing protein n=1 Tax=Halioglobus japonicus TaxID=930805 RepID=A0AAP8MI94_9GAMM|nr:TniB family NTP-binding protein [Halioglobus japonicus]AQA18973.1 hypothetical protein BST95_12695 [Halioglobus japonicus]PLW88012.1 hypothetical protein C0029_05490 [Halioglobus japonicus]GHD20454.1 hypothetical protein GCM10007052_30080 [Halioglobus japonicus]
MKIREVLDRVQIQQDLAEFMSKYVTSFISDEALNLIANVHATHFGIPRCGLIYAPTDTGKTALINAYKRQYMAAFEHKADDCEELPILHIKLPASCTIDRLLVALLKELGDIAPHKGSVAEKEGRLLALVMRRNVSLIIIDDFNRLLRDSGTSFNRSIGHYIQYLLDDHLKRPILMTGVMSCRYILGELDELERRTPFKLQLKTFDCSTEAGVGRFRLFLEILESEIPGGSISISSELMAKRLFYLSNGVPGPIKTLVEQSILAKQDIDKKLCLKDYARGFSNIYRREDIGEISGSQPISSSSKKSTLGRRLENGESEKYIPAFNPFLPNASEAKLERHLSWWKENA